ncbi:glycosyltransferase [Patescibacteria group bacterium]|nr:glycosyltransferase [Patescibacteria group bacterium]
MSVTVHSLVRNEDQFVGFALQSVLPLVDKILLYDTGSTDKTKDIINSIHDKKIFFEEKGPVSPEKLVSFRQEMIDRTKTDFFMLLDGDEVWSSTNIKKFLHDLETMPKEKIAVYCRSRNAVGDIYHYLPENAGKYQFQGRRGNFNMRGFRNIPGLTVGGVYPLEMYEYQGKSLNGWDEKLQFSDSWYLHATHLKRSSSNLKVAGIRSQKLEKGLVFQSQELPEVFAELDFPRRSVLYEVAASIVTPAKNIKRSFRI